MKGQGPAWQLRYQLKCPLPIFFPLFWKVFNKGSFVSLLPFCPPLLPRALFSHFIVAKTIWKLHCWSLPTNLSLMHTINCYLLSADSPSDASYPKLVFVRTCSVHHCFDRLQFIPSVQKILWAIYYTILFICDVQKKQICGDRKINGFHGLRRDTDNDWRQWLRFVGFLWGKLKCSNINCCDGCPFVSILKASKFK